MLWPAIAAALALNATLSPGRAQQLDLAHGGPIAITASEGIEWRQEQREVIARGNAKAIRQNVTVTADRLVAFYRPKNGAAAQPTPPAPPAQPAPGVVTDADAGGNEIYRVQAEGNVRIFTPTDQVQGDRAVYDMDKAVLVVTGHALKLTTPNDVLTARDDLEYWSQKHMAVARGNAVAVTNDGRRISADTLVAYTTDAPASPSPGTPAELGGSACRVGQTAEGGGVRQCHGPHSDRHGNRRPGGLRAGYRHSAAGWTRADHAWAEPTRWFGGGGQHEDRHRTVASGCQ